MTHSRGLTIAILGVDGAGKSTVVEALIADASLGVEMRRVKVSAHAGRKHAIGALTWSAQSLRVLRSLAGARLAVRRGVVVLWDRHPLEDGMLGQFGRHVLGRNRRWMRGLAPQPDALIVLDAPVDVLATRRPDEDPRRLRAMRDEYLRLADRHSSFVIDSSMPRDTVQEQVLTLVKALWDQSARPLGKA